MFDLEFARLDDFDAGTVGLPIRRRSRSYYWRAKRGFDVGMSLVLLPPLIVGSAALLMLNPFLNTGPLLFVQTRMGRGCKPFRAIKFRTMRREAVKTRGPDDPLEVERITALGRFLRCSRFDELPQILNVLRGEMSLIGPRPDAYDHAIAYVEAIPEYRMRYAVRPGISGLAQTQLGYAEGIDATRRKVEADLEYIRNVGFMLEARIFWATVLTVLGRKGA